MKIPSRRPITVLLLAASALPATASVLVAATPAKPVSKRKAFGSYVAKVPKKVRAAYPEAIYDENDVVVNPFAGRRMLEFFVGYVDELRDLCR